MKSYEKYKNSGVDWVGKIPNHWTISKFKYFAKIKNGKDQKSVIVENGAYPILGTGGEFGRSNEYLHNKPSLLLGRKGTIDKPQFITEPFWTVDTLFYSEIYDNTIPKYLFYLSYLIPFQLLQESSAVPSMTQDKLNNVILCRPSIQDQNEIVKYLDYKAGLIDAIIEKKELLIKKLNEQRQAIINEAVTKGLNPNAPMKDSGIEWLGEIPEHWKVVKLRYLADITTGDKDTENREDEAKYPFFVRSQTIEKISTYAFDGEAILTAGDGVGVCKVWHYINGKFDYHQRVYMMSKFKEVSGGFLFQFLKENFIHEVLKLSAKSTVDSLRRPMFLNFPVTVPPLIEQIEIVDYINSKVNVIDNSSEQIILSIKKLKSYRQSIISEAVTGKVDVRDWVQPEKN